jgi:hypothetical protein
MGNHLPDRAGAAACEIDSNTARDDGSNATSHAGGPAVEDKIYYCAGSCKSIVLERTIDRLLRAIQPQHNNQTHQTYHHAYHN